MLEECSIPTTPNELHRKQDQNQAEAEKVGNRLPRSCIRSIWHISPIPLMLLLAWQFA